MITSIQTATLEIAYEDRGPRDGAPLLLLHGWPDAPCGWNRVARQLRANGWRTIIPWLRGLAPTRFLRAETPRYAAGVALAQDGIELMSAMQIERFAVVGHDWGARAAYSMAVLYPHRVTALAALALAYQPFARFEIPGFSQSQKFWYQWFQCSEAGAAAVRRDPVGFARAQWDTWSPAGWFDESDFAEAAAGFHESDWAEITLNAYRSRWMTGEASDARYDSLQIALQRQGTISVPSLMIQGGEDFCDEPSGSEGLDQCFTGGYERIVLAGVGHFPHREASEEVSVHIERHLQRSAGGSRQPDRALS